MSGVDLSARIHQACAAFLRRPRPDGLDAQHEMWVRSDAVNAAFGYLLGALEDAARGGQPEPTKRDLLRYVEGALEHGRMREGVEAARYRPLCEPQAYETAGAVR